MTQDAADRRLISRRRFLYLSAATGAGLLAAACGAEPLPGTTPRAPTATTAAQPAATTAPQAQPTPAAAAQTPAAPQAQQTPAAVAGKNEAPQLAAMVKEGKLPPLDQRLGKAPLVVKPIEKVGKYGGQWRSGLLGGQDTAWLTRTIGNENLVRWDLEWKQVIPNVAEKFEANSDATEYTFTLREGMKWSDGQPFTADDILFWGEDHVLNKELNPGGAAEWLTAGDKPVTVEKVDATTVKFKFAAPNGLFLQRLATPSGVDPTRYPKHYLQQFHQKYNPDNVARLAQEAGAENWVKLFQLKGASVPGTPYDALWQNRDLPTLHAWMLTQPYGEVTRVVAERNPFYWKVDPEGNQLPYLDRVVYDVMQDRETLVLKALNGEIDMMDRHIATLQNKAVFFENQQKGGYHFFETISSSMNQLIIALNLTHKDKVKREIFQNKDFRIGLSYAINRKEVIDVVYVAQGEPWQAAPHKESEFYNERLAKQYTEYDIANANEHLDKAGYTQKDAEGFRLGPDGNRISFAVEVTAATGTDRVDALQLIRGHWQKVGIDAQIKEEDRSLLYSRKNANEHDAVVWGGDGGLDVILEPRYYFPYSTESNFAQAWTIWYNPGGNPRTAPEEPPEATKQQMQLYDQLKATADKDQQAALMKQILEIAADEFYCIGIVLPPNGYGIVKNNFKNVPATMPGAWLYPNPAPSNTCQYFVE